MIVTTVRRVVALYSDHNAHGQCAIEPPTADRFRDVRRADARYRSEIGDRSCYSQDAVVCPRREINAARRSLDPVSTCAVGFARARGKARLPGGARYVDHAGFDGLPQYFQRPLRLPLSPQV